MLQVHGRVGATAASPIILNLCIMAAAFVGSEWWASLGLGPVAGDRGHVERVAWSVMVAGALQLAVHLWALRHHRVRAHLRLGEDRDHVRGVVLRTLPMLLGLGVFQLNTFVDSLVASWQTMVGPTILGIPYPLREGSLTFLSYAQRLYEFPLGVFGVATATAIFPALAREADRPDEFAETLRRGLRMSFYVAFPASVGLVIVREPLAAAVYRGGRFTAEDVSMVAYVLALYAPAVWAYALQQIGTRAFYALGDTWTPVKVSLWMVGLNFLLNVLLIWTPLKVGGLALSTAVCATLQVIVMSRLLRRRVGPVMDGETVRGFGRTVMATAAMAAVTLLASLGLDASAGWAWSVASLLVLAGVGSVAYVAASRLLRMPELGWTLRR
jgi:putative peptidoglycan lipid II flippase